MFWAVLRFQVVFGGIGLLLCFVVHVMSFFAVPPGGGLLLAGLFLALYPIFRGVIFLDSDGMQGSVTWLDQGRRTFWEKVLPNCPNWMRRIVQALQVYALFAILVLAPLAVLKHDPATNPLREPATWRVISAFLMFFYGVAFAYAFSAYCAAKNASGHAA
jgi:hypothetical protein